jgi:hypothetical protein
MGNEKENREAIKKSRKKGRKNRKKQEVPRITLTAQNSSPASLTLVSYFSLSPPPGSTAQFRPWPPLFFFGGFSAIFFFRG